MERVYYVKVNSSGVKNLELIFLFYFCLSCRLVKHFGASYLIFIILSLPFCDMGEKIHKILEILE